MSISIHVRWNGEVPWATQQVAEARQLGGTTGTGYLLEERTGPISAIAYLATEAFQYHHGVPMPASMLRERLDETLRIAELRIRIVYGPRNEADLEERLQGYRNFVEFCERLERKTKRPPLVVVVW